MSTGPSGQNTPSFTEGGYDFYYISSTTTCTETAAGEYTTSTVSTYWKVLPGSSDGTLYELTTPLFTSPTPCNSPGLNTVSGTSIPAAGTIYPLSEVRSPSWDQTSGMYLASFANSNLQGTLYAASATSSEWTVGFPPENAYTSPAFGCQLWVFADKWVAISSANSAWYSETCGGRVGANNFSPYNLGGLGIYKSLNKGITWAPMMPMNYDFTSAEYVNNKTLIGVKSDNSLWLSADDGTSFFPSGLIVPGENMLAIPPYSAYAAVQLIPFQDGKFFAAASMVSGTAQTTPEFQISLYAVGNSGVSFAGTTSIAGMPGGFGYFCEGGSLCPTTGVWNESGVLTQPNPSGLSFSVETPLSRANTALGFQKNPATIEGV